MINMDELSDDIIELAAQGDIAAFERIYRSCGSFVYRVALRMVDHPQDAEEIVQDVFVRVYEQLTRFRFESSLKTWIYRIAVNMSLNYRKKRSRIRSRTAEFRENIQMQGGSEKPDFGEGDDHRQRMNRILGHLNADQRMCIILRSEGLSYEEIAQTLTININTVRTRLKRAREKLMSVRKEVMSHDI